RPGTRQFATSSTSMPQASQYSKMLVICPLKGSSPNKLTISTVQANENGPRPNAVRVRKSWLAAGPVKAAAFAGCSQASTGTIIWYMLDASALDLAKMSLDGFSHA